MTYKDPILKSIKYSLKLLLLLITGALVFVQCTDEDPDQLTSPGPDPDPVVSVDLAELRIQMANHVADHFILPAFEELSEEVASIKSAGQSFSKDQSESNLRNLRDALKATWLSWQRAAIFQIGPSETNAIRASLNTYPSDAQLIESNINRGSWTLGTIANKAAEGFPAIDYLINKDGITAEEFRNNADKLSYLSALIDDIHNEITLVSEAWNSDGYLDNFKSSSSNGTDVGSALGLLVNSIDLHLQRFLRDGKVAIPAGIRSAGVPRPLAAEAFHGAYSGELLIGAIEAYFDLFDGIGFDGTTGPSFIEYLNAIDQELLGNDIQSAIAISLDHSKALNNDFVQQIDENNDQMIEVFMTLQELVTLVKSDMSSVMGITITNQDNDGD